MINHKIPPPVLEVLQRSTITATGLRLPEQLDRELYESVNKILVKAGGKWKRSQRAHVFDADPRAKLGLALQSGVVVDEKQRDQFFPTPAPLARWVAELADVEGRIVLEPSAGKGALAIACQELGAAAVDCIEINPTRCATLRRLCGGLSTVIEGDFLKRRAASEVLTPDGRGYQRIVMNPPFSKKQDIAHVRHAMNHWLAPGGILVAIMLRSPAFEDFIDDIDASAYAIETFPNEAGAFKSSGTSVATLIFRLTSL